VGLFTVCSVAFAEVSDARKLPSATFQRFMVNGTDFKDALSACNFAREGTGWKAVSFDPPNPGGGVNCKYKKAGSSPGEQVAATLVLRCPENAAPWVSDGTNDVNKQVCLCVDGFIGKGLACVARERAKDKICDDKTYDTKKDKVDIVCKQNGGMSCGKGALGKKYGAMTCDQAKANLAKQEACAASRDDFEKACFTSVDARHQPVLDEHAQGVTSCKEAVQEKCSSSSSK
jgi:hypothetical protein